MEPGQTTPEQQAPRPEAVPNQEQLYQRQELGTEQRERLGGAASVAEQFPAQVEQSSQPPQAMPAVLPAPQVDDSAQSAAQNTTTDDTPLVASDDDISEKEWVDKAKKILSETKDEPYKREPAVKQLQIEYVRKRYGREIGDPGE